jgi:hypothetical protein
MAKLSQMKVLAHRVVLIRGPLSLRGKFLTYDAKPKEPGFSCG